MKMTDVDESTFNMILEKSGAIEGGSDVGRSHGITTWHRGNWRESVAVRSWHKDVSERIWHYEVANYLYEAYEGEDK